MMKKYYFLLLIAGWLLLFNCSFPEPIGLPPCDPIANFSLESDTVLVGSSIEFNNLSTNASDFLWDFGNGESSTEKSPVYTYVEAGKYKIALIALCGVKKHIKDRMLTVLPEFPMACFTFHLLNEICSNNCQVAFSNCSQNAKDHEWDFGDGNTSLETNPVHVYANPGSYNVRLISKNEDGTSEVTAKVVIKAAPNVYVAGYEVNASGRKVATYWKNGIQNNLTDGTVDAFANAIFISDQSVYVAGKLATGSIPPFTYAAKYWKNGVINNLSKGVTANSIFVKGNDVHVAGTGTNTGYTAKYWKNGNPTDLTGGTSAASVYVSGSDVYVAGSNGNNILKYWKNGISYDLTSGVNAVACKSMFVLGPDVYVAGLENENGITAKYWKNGVGINLTDGTFRGEAHAIFISGVDVYVAGTEKNSAGITVAKYWKNGVATNLTSGVNEANASAIFISGSDVYVAGYEENAVGKLVAKYWKNGEAFELTNGGFSSEASSIVVVER